VGPKKKTIVGFLVFNHLWSFCLATSRLAYALVDTCPGGGGGGVWIQVDFYFIVGCGVAQRQVLGSTLGRAPWEDAQSPLGNSDEDK
jgi:hypothetical protein